MFRLVESALVISMVTMGVSAESLPDHTMGAMTSARSKFDIPSQPLANALKAYTEIVPVELFYDSTIVAGLRSAPVRGFLGPDAALRSMLYGTGLMAISLSPGTATIVPDLAATSHAGLSGVKAKISPFLPYLGQVQDGVRAALCRHSALRTDPAEVFVRLWITSSGAVSRVDFISQSGSPVANPPYAAVLTHLAFAAPPPDLPQPITMMLLPRASPGAARCGRE